MANPTDSVDISFGKYLAARERAGASHMTGGVPDYAFDLDLEMRRRINAVPGIFRFFKAVTENYVPFQRQQLTLTGVRTGPNQYPEIHEMGVECARRLGIGIPQIYIQYDVQMNAFAVSVEDTEPIICLTSAIVQAMTPGELKSVIGHECGHIHNNHGIYNIAADVLTTGAAGGIAAIVPGLAAVMSLITAGVRIMFLDWSRCAEVTCDRSGMICSDDPKDAFMVNAKLGFGGGSALADINIDEYLKQTGDTQATVARFMEIANTHPVSHKRILAEKLFLQSDLFFQWRPEFKTPDTNVMPKAEVDRRCREFISVFKKAKKGKSAGK
jgi:Zn-dependent protease with chaperone function